MSVRLGVMALTCGMALLAGGNSAVAGERFGVLWPRVYAPVITGSLFDEPADEYDQAYGSDGDVEVLVPRVERRPVKRAAPPKRIVKTIAQPPKAKPVMVMKNKPLAKAALVVIKPKLKSETSASAPARPATVAAIAPKQVKAVLVLPPEKPVPKSDFNVKPAVTAVAPQAVAPKAPASNTIGCSKGIEIIEGYGFASVQPKNCSGTTYAFNAQRAKSAYIIQLSAATGEITDVKKLN